MKKEDFGRKEPSFTFEELSKYAKFDVNEIQNIKSIKYFLILKLRVKLIKKYQEKQSILN